MTNTVIQMVKINKQGYLLMIQVTFFSKLLDRKKQVITVEVLKEKLNKRDNNNL